MNKFAVSLLLILAFCCCAFAQADQPAPCPQISVMGPSQVPKPNDTITFTAKLHGDIKGLKLEYNWALSTSEIIEGQGTDRIKVLLGPSGSLTAVVEVKGFPEGCPNTASDTLDGTPPPQAVLVDELDGGCPSVSVETSFISVIDGYPMTFTAKITSADSAKLKFKWTISGGEITEGRGTPEVKVDTLGFAGEAIKATLIIRGLPKHCKTRASATGFVKPKPYLNLAN